MQPRLIIDDDQLVARFRNLQTARDVARLLEVKYSVLTYHLYRRPLIHSYVRFSMPKKNGGERSICAPVSALKILQRKLNYILQRVYKPKSCAMGFVQQRSVLTNAQAHVRHAAVLNVDLRDFFPTINFGRVRGMFMAKPYNLPAQPATVLAQICCFDGRLPQGAPTSPVVSNMISAKLDSDLLRLARRFRCTYTRYADDITFSTPRSRLPTPLGKIVHTDESTTAEIGDLLRASIEGNGFEVNRSKVRIQSKSSRQEVTGLIVNRSPNVKRKYVRQLRAIIHAIQKFGLRAAEREFQTRYGHQNRRPGRHAPSLESVMAGKLSYLRMVKGETDPVYRRLFNRYQESLGRPRVYVTDPLRDIAPALWVLECEDPIGIGSAFALKDTGLVTCQHVLQRDMDAFQHTQLNVRTKISVVASDQDLDVAILKLPSGNHAFLEIGDPTAVHQGDRLILSGFPNYRVGDAPYITEGRVARFRMVHGIKWIVLNTPIVAGNSGGPVLVRQRYDESICVLARRGVRLRLSYEA
jgi:RNA-directed DNA polymerase